MDSCACTAQHRRGLEELAIPETASSQAGFSLRSTLMHSEASDSLRTPTQKDSELLQCTPSYSEWGVAQELRAAQSNSKLSHSELRIGSIKLPGIAGSLVLPVFELRALRTATPSGGNSELLCRPPSCSELLRAGGAQELRAIPSYSELLRALRSAPNTQKLRAASPEPAVSRIASSSEPLQLCCLLAPGTNIGTLQSEEF